MPGESHCVCRPDASSPGYLPPGPAAHDGLGRGGEAPRRQRSLKRPRIWLVSGDDLEGCQSGVGVALANAVRDATGVRFTALPLRGVYDGLNRHRPGNDPANI